MAHGWYNKQMSGLYKHTTPLDISLFPLFNNYVWFQCIAVDSNRDCFIGKSVEIISYRLNPKSNDNQGLRS